MVGGPGFKRLDSGDQQPPTLVVEQPGVAKPRAVVYDIQDFQKQRSVLLCPSVTQILSLSLHSNLLSLFSDVAY